MRRSDKAMFSLCSVPSTCLQNAISSSAKTARPRRGALYSTYWFHVLRLPGSRRALGLATQGLKSHCKLALRSKSLQREHGSAAAHDVAIVSKQVDGFLFTSSCKNDQGLLFVVESATTQRLPPYVLTERHLWSRGRLPISGAALRRRVRLVSRGSCSG